MNNEQRVRLERVQLLYRQSPGLLVGLFFAGSAVFLFALLDIRESRLSVLYGWYLSLIGLIVARIFLFKAFQKATEKALYLTKWIVLFSLAVMLSGIIMGMSSVLFLDFTNPVSIVFLSIIIFGTFSGSMGALSNVRFIYYLYGVLTVVPLAIMFYFEGNEFATVSRGIKHSAKLNY